MKTKYMAIGALAFGSTVPILAVLPSEPLQPMTPQQPPAAVTPAKQMDVTSQNGLGTGQKPVANAQSNQQVQTRDTRYLGHDMGQSHEAVPPIPVNKQSSQSRDTRYLGHDMGQNCEAVPPIPKSP